MKILTGIHNLNNFISNTKPQKVAAPMPNIPTISASTQSIFKKVNGESFIKLDYPLKGKAESLKDSVDRLKDIQDNATSHKICTIVCSALFISSVVGGILATTMLLPVSIPAAIAVMIITAAVGPLLEASGFPVFPLSYPIAEQFLKANRLEGEITEQKKEIEINVAELKNFFENDFADLKKDLNDKIKQTDEVLSDMEGLPGSTQKVLESTRKELIKQKRDCEKAISELEKAAEFYLIKSNPPLTLRISA